MPFRSRKARGWSRVNSDLWSEQLEWAENNMTDRVQFYEDEEAFFNESGIDAVIIATPHYGHPELAKKAFAKGIHVLLEKPAGVYTKNVIEMNAAASSGKVFAMMFQPTHQSALSKITPTHSIR